MFDITFMLFDVTFSRAGLFQVSLADNCYFVIHVGLKPLAGQEGASHSEDYVSPTERLKAWAQPGMLILCYSPSSIAHSGGRTSDG